MQAFIIAFLPVFIKVWSGSQGKLPWKTHFESTFPEEMDPSSHLKNLHLLSLEKVPKNCFIFQKKFLKFEASFLPQENILLMKYVQPNVADFRDSQA